MLLLRIGQAHWGGQALDTTAGDHASARTMRHIAHLRPGHAANVRERWHDDGSSDQSPDRNRAAGLRGPIPADIDMWAGCLADAEVTRFVPKAAGTFQERAERKLTSFQRGWEQHPRT